MNSDETVWRCRVVCWTNAGGRWDGTDLVHFWHSLIDVVCTGDEKNRTTRATCERHEATCVRPDTASDAYSGRTPHSTSFGKLFVQGSVLGGCQHRFHGPKRGKA